METKPNIIPRVIHFVYDREENKHALTPLLICAAMPSENTLKRNQVGFPLPLFILRFTVVTLCAENPCPVTSSLSCQEKAG